MSGGRRGPERLVRTKYAAPSTDCRAGVLAAGRQRGGRHAPPPLVSNPLLRWTPAVLAATLMVHSRSGPRRPLRRNPGTGWVVHVAGIRGFPAPTSGNWERQLHSACRQVDSGVVVHPEHERGPARAPWRAGRVLGVRARRRRPRQLCTLVQARSDSLLRAPGPTRQTPVGPWYVPHAADAPASAPGPRANLTVDDDPDPPHYPSRRDGRTPQ